MKLMAIDGNSLMNRAFYGVRQLSNSQGVPTNAVYGFFNMLFKLESDLSPDAVCVCFDLKAKTFRHEQYEGYKAQRKPMPEELVQQMPLMKQALDLMGIPRLEQEGYEADDLLGTLARLSQEEAVDCVIVTGDRDSLQFIAEGAQVSLVTTKMGQTLTELYDKDLFADKYQGLTPDKIVDIKALMGDKSDNIPGVPGIGEKGAMDLLTRFGSLDGVYAHVDDPSLTPSMKKKLAEGKDLAYLSYQLAKGETHAPVAVRPSQLTRRPRQDGELFRLLSGLELRSTIKRLGLTPPKEEGVSFEAPSVEVLSTASQVDGLIRALSGGQPVHCAFDGALSACGLWVEEKAYAIRADDVGQESFSSLLRALCGPQTKLCVHAGKASYHKLLELGYDPADPFYDTALGAYLLNPTTGGYSLEDCAQSMLDATLPGADGGMVGENLSLLQEEDHTLQALGIRAAATGALYGRIAPQVERDGMDGLLRDIELPLVLTLARMEREGMALDSGRLRHFGDQLVQNITLLEQEIYRMAGEPFNIGSTKQLGSILFDKLGLKAVKKTKTGYSTDVDVLEKLKGEHKIIEAIIDYRKLTKLKSTYVDGLLKVVGADGRVHSTFHQMVTATGRLSSTDPNLQNIPVRQQIGGEIRKCFVPRSGWTLIDADYSQIELRILAHISQDPVMINAFRTGEDIHAVTASQVFHVPLEQVTHAMRSRAKAVNFGIVYGISAFSLSEDIGVFPKEAQSYIDAYLEKYTGVRQYMESIRQKAKDEGYVTTLYGRRRYLPELKSGNFNTRSFGERVALNTPIQGTAADIIKLAMLRVDRRMSQEGLRAKLILQVHDELLVEAPEEERERVCALLKQEMEAAADLAVALTADVSWGDNWYDAKQ